MSTRITQEDEARKNVSKLLDYASSTLYLQEYDYIYVQNQLLDLLKLTDPYCQEIDEYDLYSVLQELFEFASKNHVGNCTDRLQFETRLMGIVTPSPSRVIEMFDNKVRFYGTSVACKILADLSEDSAYIRRPDIDKNIMWVNESDKGDIVVTINLAKPEKTPEEVKRAKEAATGYPKCPLCAENVGFGGNAATAARQTLRTIPFDLDGEEWFMQFSPYVYFEEHLIAVSKKHRPMSIDQHAFCRMLDFVGMFPNYFIGSNAALPIVGGSILAHDHYQGGKKVLPVFSRPARRRFMMKDFVDVNVSVVDWYNSIVRLESKNLDQLAIAAEKFRLAWESYSDQSANIICSTASGNDTVHHNAITPICSINSDKEFEFDLILRNNRTDKEHPFGIFHPACDLHNIKQEAIGIIEVMGMFILPGRLASEMEAIGDLLIGKTTLDFKALATESHPLNKHLGMIAQLVADHGVTLTLDKASDVVLGFVNLTCEKILDTTAVFKNTEDGQQAFDRFINSVVR